MNNKRKKVLFIYEGVKAEENLLNNMIKIFCIKGGCFYNIGLLRATQAKREPVYWSSVTVYVRTTILYII